MRVGPSLFVLAIFIHVLLATIYFRAYFGLGHNRDMVLALGTIDQVLGVALVAWPDVAEHTFLHLSSLQHRITLALTAVGRFLRLRWAVLRGKVLNFWRRCFGGGSPVIPDTARLNLEGHALGTSNAYGVLATLEDRVAALERKVMNIQIKVQSMPAEWQAALEKSRIQRIEFRWYGVVLIILGLALVGLVSIA